MTVDRSGDAASGAADAVPVCPRHPGVVSYVRCQRCERPVCPACQRPAAVGVQCVDCVRDQARTVRAPRTVFGGRPGGLGRPVVTQLIIVACVGVFVLQWLSGEVTSELAFTPSQAVAQPYRFLTAAFLHSPTFLLHIVMNMYALWTIGPYLERLLGAGRFAALYLLSALGGSVGYFVLATPSWEVGDAWTSGTVGASGAVFGLFSAILVINRRLGRDVGPVAGVIAVNLVLGFLPNLNIAWQAHLGGLVTGALASWVIVALAPSGRTAPGAAGGRARQLLGLVGVLVLLVVATLAKVATVPAGFLS
jgi:membrane associated rhomboid family serine protease